MNIILQQLTDENLSESIRFEEAIQEKDQTIKQILYSFQQLANNISSRIKDVVDFNKDNSISKQ